MGESEEGEGKPTHDLRRSEHRDFGVRVRRDFTGSSDFLATGNKTRFSSIRFTLEPTAPPENSDTHVAPPEEPASALIPPPSEPQAAAPVAEPEGLVRRIGRILGLASDNS